MGGVFNMFCKGCGTQNLDNAKYCENCGEKLTFSTERFNNPSSTGIKEVKGSYNKWVRALGFIVGALTLLGSVGSGWPYYFESGIQLVLICEILLTPISIFLILLGAFPNYIKNILSPWIDMENNYSAIVGIIIVLLIIIVALEPEPSVGWWDYNGTWF